jgi:phosphoglycerate dehydrogenase-like enzyme
MPRVLVSDSLSEQGLAILRQQPGFDVDYKPGLNEEALAAAIPGADALVIRSGSKVTARVLEAATNLRVIGRAGIGIDNVDVPAASKRGVVVMNTPTGNAVTTAEHALALLFSLARMIPQASQTLKAGKWEKKKFEGRELAGKTLGVIGLGNIGRIVADRAKGLKMHVIGFDPVLTADRAKLQKGVLLVNAARGGIFDEEALLRGLESGKIGGVALDVFLEEPPPNDLPILKHERVVVTPHLGASTKEAQDRVALEIAEQVAAYLTTGAITNAVNVTSVSGETASKLSPWIDLADKLGKFIAQTSEKGTIKAFEVECVGEPAGPGFKAIAASALAGFLQRFLEEHVNQVSAPHLAADRGIVFRELASADTGQKFTSLIVARVTGEDGSVRAVEGTLGTDRTARLVKWGDFEVEAQLGGRMLVVESADRPGVIGFLGTSLGGASVNVSRVHLSLSTGGRVISVWNLDQEIPADVFEGMRRSENVSSAKVLDI